MRLPGLAAVAALAAAAAATAVAAAPPSADSPRLWGPAGDGRAAGALVATGRAPKARELWRRPIGSGYSGIAIADGRGYTAYAADGHDFATAFDAATGRELWRQRIGATYKGHDGSQDGPISTPSVAGGRVFLVGPHGALVAFDAATGAELWRHDLAAEMKAGVPSYGFATSPLVLGDRVIVQAGGATDHHVVAFDAKTGARAWSARPAELAVYASVLAAKIAGVPQVVGTAGDKAFGLDPATGAVLWSHPLKWQEEVQRSPLVLPDGSVYAFSWQEAALLRVTRAGGQWAVSEVWRTPRIRTTYSPTVYHGGSLFGFNGSFLVCVDPNTGVPRWRERVYGGSLVVAGEHLVILGDSSGEIRIADAAADGYHERLRVPVFDAGASSVTTPVVAGSRVYVRNLEEMVALEIGG
jgi:outer membrane protein assembly factor BamB